MSIDILITIIAIPVVNWLVGKAKDELWMSGKVALVVVSFLVALLYGVFSHFVPETLQQNLIGFWSEVGFWAVLVYEFLIKKIK